MSKITAVILAAGVGKRFKPLTTAKPLIPLGGKTLLEWVAGDLKQIGINELVVVANPSDEEAIKTLLPQAQVVIQPEPKGMADAVLATSGSVPEGPIVVVNGDDLIDPNIFASFKDQISEYPDKMAVTGWKIDRFLPGGYLKIDGSQVTGVVEKPEEGEQPSDYLTLVLHYFPDSKEWFSLLSKTESQDDDVYEQALNQILGMSPAQLVKGKGYFQPLKYAHHLLDLTELILNKRLKGENLIDDSAQIMEGAVVKNSYIGPKVVIGNNVLVRDSIIEEGSVVGFGSEVARSYVGPKSWFHCNYVGDSVIEGGSNMGSGARLANWRFDGKPVRVKTADGMQETGKTKLGAIIGKGAKLGINTSVMPGITIGENSIVGSGVVLNEAVSPGQFVA